MADSPWPALALQIAYADVAWTVVIAAALLAMLPRRWYATRARAWAAAALLVLGVALALHGVAGGAASQALGLAFAQPSGLLSLLAAASLARAVAAAASSGSGSVATAPVLPTPWAWGLAAAGVVFALDTVNVLGWELYRLGLPGSPWAAGIAVALAVGAIALARWPRQRVAALALGGALALHAVLGLPTGNLWDALFDPLLWAWAVGAAVRRVFMR
ncbi:MAG: hypothetical protein MUC74_06940 [Ideonella sp.]|jgi:hypothetical protein|nr:hypothetical protein [Ideonella sp.]